MQTIAAPDGRSHQKERNKPAIPPSNAMSQPMRSGRLILVRQIDSANRRHNQITEDEQNAGDADETRHDQTEDRVKEKIPPAHAQTFFVSRIAIEGDEQKISAQNEMENTDDDKKCEAFPNFTRRHEQNISDEHVFDFLVAFRRAAQEQDRGGRRHDVGDADDRFLRNLARRFPVTEKIAAPTR